jgi:hypothetical protein
MCQLLAAIYYFSIDDSANPGRQPFSNYSLRRDPTFFHDPHRLKIFDFNESISASMFKMEFDADHRSI